MNDEEPGVSRSGSQAAVGKTSWEEGQSAIWLIVRSWFGFVVLWLIFYGMFRAYPYLSSGAEVIYRAKIDQEIGGTVFPESSNLRKVLVFGDSEVLAGFVPDEFDKLAASDGLNLYSYNSGYPARGSFVPELQTMVQKASGVPNILLLTLPWAPNKEGSNAFRLLQNDHDIADRLFPFRYLARDTLSFLVTSRERGGPTKFYGECQSNTAKMLRDRGYYFISEQSHYPNDSLPDDFHLGTDTPGAIEARTSYYESEELNELNRIVVEHNIRCYYIPTYARKGSIAAAPDTNLLFAKFLSQHTSCQLLGPDYYLYPNRMFSDSVHLNRLGAKVYTEDIFRLVAKQMIGH
jgi:hypothetical protein